MSDETLNPRLLPTRQSLLSRLKSWDDQDSWRQFFDTYWRLIYEVAMKAGLPHAEAMDVVQETIVVVAKQMPNFKYDRKKGTFKGWLMRVTHRRIADQLRHQYRHGQYRNYLPQCDDSSAQSSDLTESITNEWEQIWNEEWQTHLTASATARVKQKVMPQQFQIFELNVIHGWPARKVTETLGVTLMQVYLAKHRVGSLFRSELKAIELSEG